MLSEMYFKPIFIKSEKTKYIINPYGTVINTTTNHTLKWKIDTKGYPHVILSHNAITYDKRIHVLVASLFVKNKNPDKFTIVNHLDGNKCNPDYRNLEWTDYSGNVKHAIQTGLLHPAYGEKSGKASLTNRQVHEICKIMENGSLTQREIAHKFKVSEAVIYEIRLGNNWKSISKDYHIENCKLSVSTLPANIVIDICKELEKDELLLSEISKKYNVKYDIILGILNKRSYKRISDNFNIDKYSHRLRYDKSFKDKVFLMMRNGKSNLEIIEILNLNRYPRTNTFLYRCRKELN